VSDELADSLTICGVNSGANSGSRQSVDQIAQELKRWPNWNVCDRQDLSRDTSRASLGTAIEDTPYSLIPIEKPFDEFMAARSQDLRRNLRRYREKAEAMAPVTFEVAETADESLLCALIQLYRARWVRMGEKGFR
jgi:hypothetical protein